MESAGRIQDFARRPAMVDWPSALVIAAMVAGSAACVVGAHLELLSLPLAALLGTGFMNLSFTAWHEPAHGNLARSRRVNTVAGVIASVASVYPGYFARRREHLVHHRFESDPARDPVHARIQCEWWRFPFRLARMVVSPAPLDVPDDYLPMTPAQRWADRVSNGVAAVLCVASVAWGFWPALLAGWIVPRGVVFLLHAWYICYLPHAVPGGGYAVHRLRPGRALGWLTVGQNLHGIHHRWPSVPWHRYAAVLRGCRSEVDESRMETV